ncbi:peptide chain release factor N(5)-glutamine methyltransferase [Patescibacteria group bacterium]|nr:peptide chain release factor N(5)-glutamine methyltransferase [Patescibacteria group bacterium]
MNIQQALKKSTNKFKLQNIPSADLDAEVLLLEALNKIGVHSLKCNRSCSNQIKTSYRLKPELRKDKSWLYAHNDYKLTKNEEGLFKNFINQRKKHKPVAYITNRKEFYGYEFYVDENVLIPRPETEIIVEEVLKILNNKIQRKFTLIDIGTGSGCIIISILNELTKNKNNKVIHSAYANDISQEAIKIAKVNAEKYNLNKKIKFVENNFEKFLDKKNIYSSNELITTANLPYIKDNEYENLLPNVRKYEPKTALVGGEDGLVYIKKLIESILKIKEKYKQKIYIFIEADPSQISEITAIINKKLANAHIKIIKDLNGKKRIAILSHC